VHWLAGLVPGRSFFFLNNLAFYPGLVLVVFLPILITSQVAGDGESNWLKGVQLIAVYVILGIVFFFCP
jgi:Ca2+:H+ antiporter